VRHAARIESFAPLAPRAGRPLDGSADEPVPIALGIEVFGCADDVKGLSAS